MDQLIESIEVLTVDIGKLNFEFESLKEEFDRMEENQPYMHRQLDAHERRMSKMVGKINIKMKDKQTLETEFGALQMKMGVEKKEAADKAAGKKPEPQSLVLDDKPKD